MTTAGQFKSKPRLGIFGMGNFGGRLITLTTAAGYDVLVAKRENALSVADQSQIFVIAIPFLACASALPPLAAALGGKIVVDPTNPLNPDWSPVLFGDHGSGGEEMAKLLPNSKLVKAFNTVFADTMTNEGLVRDGHHVTTFICGDDMNAKRAVCELAASLGFAPLDSGPLRNCRYLEAIAYLNVHLVITQGGGTDAALIYDRPRTQA